MVTTLQDIQALVQQIKDQLNTVSTNQQQIGEDFVKLKGDVDALITAYQGLGGQNQDLIDSINTSLQSIQTGMGNIATAQTAVDQAISGEDTSVTGATGGGSGPDGGSPAGSQSGTQITNSDPGAAGSSQAAEDGADAPSPQGPIHGQ